MSHNKTNSTDEEKIIFLSSKRSETLTRRNKIK